MKIEFRARKRATGVIAIILLHAVLVGQTYKIVDTNQEACYDTINQITPPSPGNPFYGQDAQYNGNQPAYNDNGDGTVSDLVTGLMWQKNLFADKLIYDEVVAGADTCTIAGYDDWRLPTIKELYSLIFFSGYGAPTEEQSVPFIDTGYFEFRYGDVAAGERFIDAQYASGTEYVGTTMIGAFTIFGVNFADGRIKGYGTDPLPGQTEGKLFEVRYVRENTAYGINDFTDNTDGTITDSSTGLMWTKSDSEEGLNWEGALAWVQQKNSEIYLGYNDWRLPNAKELQSLVDYSRSPQTSNSAAIDPLFETSTIIDEGGELNYPFFWTGTTHADGPVDMKYTRAVYLCFGEALGFMEMPPGSGNYVLLDVHGAGAQRSDFKTGDPENYPYGHGPQGDVVRIYNYIRLVRSDSSVGINDTKRVDLGLNIFPNPSSGKVTIQYTLTTTDSVKIECINLVGKQISVISNVLQIPGSYSINWYSDIPAGIYLVRIASGPNVSITKLIIH